MNKTPRYELNQWELSDPVRMEDFNADNAKVESALAGLDRRTRYQKSPLSMVIPYSLSTCTMNNRFLKWEEFSVVHYIFNIVVDANNPIVCLVERHPHDVFKELAYMEGNLDPENRMKQAHLIFFPMYDKTRPAEALAMGMGDTRYINFGVPFEQLPDLQICTKQVGNTRPHGLMKDTYADIYTRS
jgi:hypothetical protein